MANKKIIGNLGEDIALKYLEGLGYTLVERNFKGKKTRGEIDLVMTKGEDKRRDRFSNDKRSCYCVYRS